MINVCNYTPCKVIAVSNVQDYIFDGCEHKDAPVINPISAVELRNIHSRSSIFTDGYLTFEDDVKKDVYEYLKINNWENILTQDDIIDTILNCTKEKLQKIIDITSLSYFERVRGIYVALKQSNADVSMRVANVIETRYKELRQNKYKSAIQLKDVSFSSNDNNDDKELIVKQQKQIEEKDKELNELLAKFAELQSKVEQLQSLSQSAEDEKTTPSKKRGRPAKTTE
jgi:hypothetical protein